MTALDACEPQIIRAMEKAGWEILDKPFDIRVSDEKYLYADFSARYVDEHGEHYIVVMEVKCFTNPAHDIHELYVAIGQYRVYRSGLNAEGKADLPLYLALPYEAYLRLSRLPTLVGALVESAVQWVVVDIVREVVLEWHP